MQGNEYTTQVFSDHANLQYFITKQMLTHCQVCWSLFLATFDYVIIPKPGKFNKANRLSRHPDYKEGIASENAECVLLSLEKFLLKPQDFSNQALHNTVIPTEMNKDLKEAIEEGIKADCLTGDKLKEILLSSP